MFEQFVYLAFIIKVFKVSKGAKIRNKHNQAQQQTQDTNGKAKNPQPETSNESPEGSPFPAGDYKAHTNRDAHKDIANTRQKKHKRSTTEVPPWNGQ